MTSEKVDAFWRGWFAMAYRMHRLQVEWMLAAMRTWSTPLGIASAMRPGTRASAVARRRVERAVRELAGAALVPVHGAVTRNARRLSRKKP
jgi:hypothetical protein